MLHAAAAAVAVCRSTQDSKVIALAIKLSALHRFTAECSCFIYHSDI
jgi:hypothetical protein